MTHENYQCYQRVRLVRRVVMFAPSMPRRDSRPGEVVTLRSSRGPKAWVVDADDGYRAVVDLRDISPEAQPGLFAPEGAEVAS